MKAAHLIHSVDNPATGPANSVYGLGRALVSIGVEVEILTLDWETNTVKDPMVHRFPLGFGPRKLGRSPEMLEWLLSNSSATKSSIVHSHTLWMSTGYYPLIVKRRNPSNKVVFSPHGALSAYSLATGSRLKLAYWPLIQRPALAAADCLHATSEGEREDIRRLGFRTPIALIPNGVQARPQPDRSPTDLRTVVFLGRLHPEKGLVGLLKAWGELEADGTAWRLQIVGPDPIGYRAELEKLVRTLDLRRVTFEGPALGEQKWRTLEAAEILILPSPSENFGIVVAEALSIGVPVIATVGTPWSQLSARNAGWYCGPAPADIADALRRATATDLNERRSMGDQGRRWMRDHFAWDSIGAKMAETYNWLLHGGQVPTCVDL